MGQIFFVMPGVDSSSDVPDPDDLMFHEKLHQRVAQLEVR